MLYDGSPQMTEKIDWASNLRTYRNLHEINMTQAAKKAGIPLSEWSRIERGVKEPTNGNIEKLNKLFEKDNDLLFPDDFDDTEGFEIAYEGAHVTVKPILDGKSPTVKVDSPKQFLAVEEFKGGGYLVRDESGNYYTVYPLS